MLPTWRSVSPVTQPRLYGDLAKWWPLVSPVEDYAAEAEILRSVFREKLGPGRHSLLDLGVGAGHHLFHIVDDFDAAAVDVSTEMLAHSRRLNAMVEHYVGDMRSIRLERTFDAVLIHDAIACMLSEDDLRATFKTALVHLRPGGVLVALPDWFKETFRDHFVSHATHRRDDTDLTYIEYVHDPDPADTTIEMIMFLLIRQKGQVHIEQDRHVIGLFPKSTWLNLTHECGFEVETRPFVEADAGERRTLLVGVRRV